MTDDQEGPHHPDGSAGDLSSSKRNQSEGHAATGDYVDADASLLEGRQPPSARASLTREKVIAAAVDFIDSRGLSALTMRRLGEQLGVEAMALYRYVPGREDLLDAVVGQIINEMYDDDEVAVDARDGWQDFLQRLAHGVRRVALRHPKVFPLVASRPPEAPWLRPPLRSLDWVETFLAGMTTNGFSPASTVTAYRCFTSFLLGHLLLEVALLGADLGPLDVLEEAEEPPAKDLRANFPNVAQMRQQLSEDNTAVEFEESLEDLINRIALIRLEQDNPPEQETSTSPTV